MPKEGRFSRQTFLEFAELHDTGVLRLPLLGSDVLSAFPVLVAHAHVREDFGPEPGLELVEIDLRISSLEELPRTKAVSGCQDQGNLRDVDGEDLTCRRILPSARLLDDLHQVLRDPVELLPAYTITFVVVMRIKQDVEVALHLPEGSIRRYLDLQKSGDRQNVVELEGPFDGLNGLLHSLEWVDCEHRAGLKENQIECALLNSDELFRFAPALTQCCLEALTFWSYQLSVCLLSRCIFF